MKTKTNVRAPAALSERERVCKNKKTNAPRGKSTASMRRSVKAGNRRVMPGATRESDVRASVPSRERRDTMRGARGARARRDARHGRHDGGGRSEHHHQQGTQSIDATPFSPSRRVVFMGVDLRGEDAFTCTKRVRPSCFFCWSFSVDARRGLMAKILIQEEHSETANRSAAWMIFDGFPIRYRRLAMRPKRGCSEWS